jgi:hypothetical protein
MNVESVHTGFTFDLALFSSPISSIQCSGKSANRITKNEVNETWTFEQLEDSISFLFVLV